MNASQSNQVSGMNINPNEPKPNLQNISSTQKMAMQSTSVEINPKIPENVKPIQINVNYNYTNNNNTNKGPKEETQTISNNNLPSSNLSGKQSQLKGSRLVLENGKEVVKKNEKILANVDINIDDTETKNNIKKKESLVNYDINSDTETKILSKNKENQNNNPNSILDESKPIENSQQTQATNLPQVNNQLYNNGTVFVNLPNNNQRLNNNIPIYYPANQMFTFAPQKMHPRTVIVQHRNWQLPDPNMKLYHNNINPNVNPNQNIVPKKDNNIPTKKKENDNQKITSPSTDNNTNPNPIENNKNNDNKNNKNNEENKNNNNKNNNDNKNNNNIKENIDNKQTGYGFVSYASITKEGRNQNGIIKINQDTPLVHLNVGGVKGFNLFGVLDGHGLHGHLISQFCKDYFIKRCDEYAKKCVAENITTAEGIYEKMKSDNYNFIYDCFKRADNEMGKHKEMDCRLSGTTCNIIFQFNDKIVCANVGDSRSILVYDNDNSNKNLGVIPLSEDHNPNIPKEKERIIKSGGVIDKIKDTSGNKIGPDKVFKKGYNYPGLSLTRSLGDFEAKKCGVISTPDIVKYKITSNIKYIVICSDGIWEFLKNEDVRDLGNKFYPEKKIGEFCHSLIDEAIQKWNKNNYRRDDITVVCIYLH